MDLSRAAVVVFAIGAALCLVFAVIIWTRRRPGRVSWRGAAIDYRLRAVYLAMVGVALALHASAVGLANAGDAHAGFRLEMTALAILVLAALGAVVADRSARRHEPR